MKPTFFFVHDWKWGANFVLDALDDSHLGSLFILESSQVEAHAVVLLRYFAVSCCKMFEY